MLQRVAGKIANRETVPTAIRAVLGYYAQSGTLDYASLRLKSHTDDVVEGLLRDAYADIEEALAESFGYSYVSFDYDTKLVLPAKLTLGYLYRRLPESEHPEAREVTRLVTEALIDGDMRDAVNDDEFADFEVDFTTSDDRRVAKIAQEVLQARVEEQFSRYPEALRETYDWAVDVSQRHQERDEQFRELMARAREGDREATEQIRAEYRTARFEEPPSLFTDEELALPYLKTQYDRVGIIYEAMVEMYRAAGFGIDRSFERSIVLAIIGAQVWLDDVDDFETDMREKQLTPVTAEYLLADDDATAYRSTVEISRRYLERARREATEADSTLTGIATEYIYRNGDPGVLPGHK
jgi:hypothetical protein